MARKMKTRLCSAEVRAVPGMDRTLTFTASTEEVARDDDIVLASGWEIENFMKNPVILWGHNYGEPPIGRGVDVRKIAATKTKKGRLEADIEFAGLEQMHDLAETVYMLYRDGFLKAVSVGFIPKEYKQLTDEERTKLDLPRWGTVTSRAELLEISAVSVPADAGALVQNGIDPEHAAALVSVRGIARPEDVVAIDQILDVSEKSLTEPEPDPIIKAVQDMGAEITASFRADLKRAVRALRKKSADAPPRSVADLPPDEPPEDAEEDDLYGIAQAIENRQRRRT